MNVSVIIPAYNREKTIKRTILSVLNQTVPPIEIIVVDDYSADSTVEIVKEICRTNKCISLLQMKRNCGAQAARNYGIKKAKGEWIILLDSDDELLEHSVECYIKAVKENPGYDIYYGDYYDNKNGKIKYINCRMRGRNGCYFENILYSSKVLFQNMIVQKSALENIGLLDEHVPAYQEWDTHIKLAMKHRYYYIHKPMFMYYSLYDGETISKDLVRAKNGFRFVVISNWDIFKKFGVQSIVFYFQGIFWHYKRCDDCKKYFFIVMMRIVELLSVSRLGSNVCMILFEKLCKKSRNNILGVKNGIERNKKKRNTISYNHKK